MRYFCRVEYDGTNYAGWQSQSDQTTIQSVLESAFSTVLRRNCLITGAGRTDAGVHSRGQGIHFDMPESIETEKLEYSINSILPSDIAVYDVRRVEDSFHARFSAVKRVYKYYIVFRKKPLLHQRAWRVGYEIDWSIIQKNYLQIIGTHDFTSFCATGSNASHAVCTIMETNVELTDQMAVLTIAANRFLYRMVRSLVGTLIDIGRGHHSSTLLEIISAKDRRCVGQTAAAWGLVLDYVHYNEVK